MIPSYSWWDLPGVHALCGAVVDDLLDSRSVVWRFPTCFCTDVTTIEKLVDQVIRDCKKYGIDAVEIDVRESKDRHPPVLLLAELTGLSRLGQGNGVSPKDLIYHEDWPDLVILLGLDSLTDDSRQRWIRFLTNWSEVAHGAPLEYSRKVLLVPTTDLSIAASDVRITEHRFWGCISKLEMQYLVRLAFNKAEPDTRYWAEAVLPELACGDPFLLDWLTDNHAETIDEILKSLRAYGLQLGWDASSLNRNGAPKVLRLSYPHRIRWTDPGEFDQLWELGAVVFTPERGLELHSSALAMLGFKDRIAQRIWRGQTALLYPMLDSVRFDVCRYLCRFAGDRWVHLAQASHPFDVVQTTDGPVSQFGHLLCVLKSPGLSLPRAVDKRVLVQNVKLLVRARNKLAHYEPLSREEFNEVLGAISELGNRVL